MADCQDKMNILNYTTKVPVDRTVGELHKLLAQHKATAIMTEYGPEGEMSALSFRVLTEHGVMTFRLPSNVDKVLEVMRAHGKMPSNKLTKEHAARVAWRIIKDAVASQLALVSVNLVKLEQVFLPYAQVSDGRTLYETLEDGKFRTLCLPPSK